MRKFLQAGARLSPRPAFCAPGMVLALLPLMRDTSFKPLSSPPYGLGEIKYFLLGLMADAVFLGCFFAYLWKVMPVDCRGTCTMYEYLMVGRYVLWMEMVYVIGLWPISLPVLAAPPGVGL